jgi:hypothetical protein
MEARGRVPEKHGSAFLVPVVRVLRFLTVAHAQA